MADLSAEVLRSTCCSVEHAYQAGHADLGVVGFLFVGAISCTEAGEAVQNSLDRLLSETPGRPVTALWLAPAGRPRDLCHAVVTVQYRQASHLPPPVPRARLAPRCHSKRLPPSSIEDALPAQQNMSPRTARRRAGKWARRRKMKTKVAAMPVGGALANSMALAGLAPVVAASTAPAGSAASSSSKKSPNTWAWDYIRL